MPVYQFECLACEIVFEDLQDISSSTPTPCPACGKECNRIVSQVSVTIRKDISPDKAAQRGFTTYKRAGEGVWEKQAGEGRDMIMGSAEDIKEVKQEKKRKVYDLDKK